MIVINPHMLPKVRSESLRKSAIYMPCTLRIAGFSGHACAGRNTNVMAHLPVHGKGIATKVSDLHIVCACAMCHDLLDARNTLGILIREKYPHAFWERVMLAYAETLSRWVAMGLITGEDWEIV